MENNLVNKQEIAALKAKRLSFNRRKACIRKKTMELSVLCDVNACVFIVDGSEVETWPENQHDVLNIIKKYKKYHGDVDDNKEDTVDDHQNKSWEDHLIDGLPIESLEEMLKTVDSKLEALVRRIEAVKIAAANKHPNNDDNNNENKGREKMIFNPTQQQQQQQIITQAPIYGKGNFKDEESDFCFGKGSSSTSGMGAAVAEAELGFLNMQAFLHTPCVQESSTQHSSSSNSRSLPNENKGREKMIFNPTQQQQQQQIITQAPIYGKGNFKDEESDFCFGKGSSSTSGMGAAVAEAELGFMNMQAFLHTPCVQESSNQEHEQHKYATSEQRFFSYMQPLQINPFNIQESDQILYYLPHGQYLQPPHTAHYCSPARLSN